ncbi:nicotinate-nucleotide adenylyltransferase [Candidatus Omnitrophota bacterium]
MKKIRRIGIFGGTFNPIHMGHLVLAEQVRARLRLEKVIFVPSNLPPHKRSRPLVTAQQRYQMVALAIQDNPYFHISDIELTRGGRSYSVETVEQLSGVLARARLYFIVGSDFSKDFTTWKDFAKLQKLCQFVIAQRPGYAIRRVPKNMRVLAISALDISSSDIRQRVQRAESIRYLVPEKIRKYIWNKKLYR